LKFTDRGGVTIEVRTNGRPGSLALAVVDTGIGIPEGKRAQIFERFVQAESSTTRRFGGTGLGLAIVRELVDAMSGSVRVTETLHGGSTFVVELALEPCELSPLRAVGGESSPAPLPIAGSRRVLLAEDDLVNRKLVTRLLERAGCSVRAAENGVVAVAAAIAEDFDLILMDIEMPELDGYGATAAIRRHDEPSGRKSTILALTAHVLPETRAACVAAGMDGYLSKPLAMPELVAALHEWCPRPLAG